MYPTEAIRRSLRITLVLRATIIANRSFVQVARLLASLFVQTGNGGCDLSRFSVAVLYIHTFRPFDVSWRIPNGCRVPRGFSTAGM